MTSFEAHKICKKLSLLSKVKILNKKKLEICILDVIYNITWPYYMIQDKHNFALQKTAVLSYSADSSNTFTYQGILL